MNIPPPTGPIRAASRWFIVGVTALALAGLFAFLMLSSKAFFHKGLVIHVDLSILIWFMAIAGMLWRLHGKPSVLGTASFLCFSIGTLCLPAASFFASGTGLMNNYIPIITHPLFYIGLSLVLCGIVFAALQLLFSTVIQKTVSALPGLHPCFSSHLFIFALATSAMIVLIAVAALFLTYPNIPPAIIGEQFYDLLFWSGGHILQFAHTQIVMLVWLCLASISGIEIRLPQRFLYMLFGINLLAALAGLIGARLDPTSSHYYDFFTRLMRDGNGIAPAILILALLHAFTTQKRSRNIESRAPFAALTASILLFSVGGLIGFGIRGSNVIVPAHYHGSIVGITLAYMGLCYYLMPRFGFAAVGHWRLALLQPILYAAGQLCWITGMIILGGYGVARKQTNVPDIEAHYAKLGEILKHSGDGIAVLGGLLFVVIVLMAYLKRPATAHAASPPSPR